MTDIPVQLIVAAFKTEDGAENALKQLKDAQRERLIKIENAAVLRKDPNGKLHVKDIKDMGGGKGAVIGGVVGAALAVITGGASLALVGAGALIGGVGAKMSDSGFRTERLQKLGEGLTPGSSAIVAVIDHTWVADMERDLQEQGAQVLTEAISADIAAQLGAGREVSYTAVGTSEGMSVGRVATGDDLTEVSSITQTSEGVEAINAVATKEGVAAEHIVATSQGTMYEAAAMINQPTETASDKPAIDAPAADKPAADVAATDKPAS